MNSTKGATPGWYFVRDDLEQVLQYLEFALSEETPEVESRVLDMPVMVAARIGIGGPCCRYKRRQSFWISRAALWPEIPDTPPPGCVVEPHRYKARIGER